MYWLLIVSYYFRQNGTKYNPRVKKTNSTRKDGGIDYSIKILFRAIRLIDKWNNEFLFQEDSNTGMNKWFKNIKMFGKKEKSAYYKKRAYALRVNYMRRLNSWFAMHS